MLKCAGAKRTQSCEIRHLVGINRHKTAKTKKAMADLPLEERSVQSGPMRRNVRLAVILLSSSLALGGSATAQSQTASAPRPRPQTWEQDERGEWVQVNAPPRAATAPAADVVIDDPTLDQVENLLSAGRHDAALKRVIAWIKAHPDAPDRDRGLFLLAEAYRQHGDGIRAFYHLDELMEYYPTSRLYYPALEKQFVIADEYLNGRKRVVLGFLPVGAKDEAVEMLFRIQERSPGSPIAERSLLRTADHYYDDSQFDLAADAYGAYLKTYPRSPEVPRVSLYRAFASLAQFRGLRG
jgi:tetratricopeptide (TPR) repeat protein